ncbi:MAG TPA: hypothetical protein VM076_03565 [Gemmatimonadaceae bacterium]|nr:hypothetical protein [Gemmatimonadaceae bacterium]
MAIVRLSPPTNVRHLMRPLLRASTAMLFLVTAASASAQPGVPGSPVTATADFLLAHTGDLALTDAQVVRLAAISRRTDARRKTLAARMDSARTADRLAPGDSGRRGPGGRPGGPPPAELQQMREQVRTDVREAIAVLTPDQQASAWMMVAGGGPPAARDVPRRPDDASSSTTP